MRLITTLLATACAFSGALASPVTEPAPMMEVAASGNAKWLVSEMKRKCDTKDTVCNWSFTIDTRGVVKKQSCSHKVEVKSPRKASQQKVDPFSCGPFKVSFNWSGQFGEGKGFTTFAVVLRRAQQKTQIIYPAYSDTELKNGEAAPDKEYTPEDI